MHFLRGYVGALWLLGFGCSEPRMEMIRYEGAEPGECDDGADNDIDGFYDCEDPNCAGAPVCRPVDAGSPRTEDPRDAGGPAPQTEDAAAEPAVAAHLTSIEVDYSVQIDLDALGDSLCGSAVGNICDCTNVYRGTGVQLVAEGNRVTFAGTWELVSTTCTAESDFANLFWLPRDGDSVHHTIVFESDLSELDDWIVHRDEMSYMPFDDNIRDRGQYWIQAMDEPFIDTAPRIVEHMEAERAMVDVIQILFTHDVKFAFGTDPVE